MRRRVLCIGLDGATWDLLTVLMEAGVMPYLHSLIETSAWGTMVSTTPAITPVAWSSFQTGVNPGRHGVFGFRRFTDDGSFTFVNASGLKARTLWEHLSDNGRCVVSINVPLTYPPSPVSGAMVSGLLAPSVDGTFTYPDSLGAELSDRLGGYLLPAAGGRYRPHEDFVGTVNYLIEMIDNRFAATEELMQRYDWDFLMVHFQAVDMIQHPYWNILQEFKANADSGRVLERKRVATFYTRLDEILRSLIEPQDLGTTTIIVSDHGFRLNEKVFNLNRWLAERELVTFRDKGFLARTTVQSALSGIGRLAREKLGLTIPRKLGRSVAERVKPSAHSLLDLGLSSVLFISSNEYGLLYVGRDLSGSERERLKSRLIQELREVTDPATGSQVIDKVLQASDIYDGPYVGDAPDLIVIPNRPYSVSTNLSPHDQLLRETKWGVDRHLGTHADEGIVLLYGDLVRAGRIQQVTIYDVLPTILRLLEVSVPGDLDGRFIAEAFETEVLPSGDRSAKVDGSATSTWQAGRASLTEAPLQSNSQEEDLIEERLRDLGYIQ